MIVSGNRTITVNNITERNNIEIKTRGLRVIVLDAILDNINGKAIYAWDTSSNSFILDSESTPDIGNKLFSNDVNLDSLQEIVDYIKALKTKITDLETEIETMKTSRFLSVIG